MSSAIRRTIPLLASLALLTMAHPAQADDAVVGSGHALGCTEAAIDAALGQLYPGATFPGGVLSFNCGSAAVTIPITAQKSIGFGTGTTIDGGGLVTLDANGLTRHFVVTGSESRVEIRNIFLINGDAGAGNGGSIHVDTGAALLLQRTLLRDNRAGFAGGAILSEPGSALVLDDVDVVSNDAPNGGGIAANGALSIGDSLIALNTAESGEGGGLQSYFNSVTLLRTRFENNSAVDGGAMLLHGATVAAEELSISDNSASARGGGIWIDNGGLELDGATLARNFADRGGALYLGGINDGSGSAGTTTYSEIYATDVALEANQAREGGAAWVFGVGPFTNGRVGRLTLVRSRALGNQAERGGAIWTQGYYSMDDTRIVGNTAIDGGGLYFAPTFVGSPASTESRTGENLLQDSIVADNIATSRGGGSFATLADIGHVRMLVRGNRAARGGGIAYSRASTATVRDVSLIDNQAALAGGALYVETSINSVRVERATLAGNRTDTNGCGGHVYATTDTSAFPSVITRVFVFESTLVEGSATTGGLLCADSAGVIAYGRSVLGQDSSLVNCSANAGGLIDSLGGNAMFATTCPSTATDTVVGTLSSLRLGPLAFNGNNTPTMLPQFGSPVIDNHSCAPASLADQRGEPRNIDGDADGIARCDAGAVELQLQEAASTPFSLFRDGFES